MRNAMSIFVNRFKTDEDCYKFLSEIKWPDGRFACAKCGNTTYHKGRSPYSRRCNRCKHDESVTAGTMFNKLKFSILIAFKIVFSMVAMDKENSSVELAEKHGIQRKTCQTFKRKVQQAMGSMQQKRLTGTVEIDIVNIAKHRAQDPWWVKDPERYIAIAIEVSDGQSGRAFAVVVNEDKQTELIPIIERYVHPDATILTTGHYGYKTAMKKRFKNLSYIEWERFTLLYGHFLAVQDWIGKEYGHYTSSYLQGFLDEFHFRYNRRHNYWRYFDCLIREMAKNN